MFRPKSDAIQIGQDSFKIPARNGNAFGPDSIIRFDVPRNAGFVDLANSYLECEVLLENANNTAADQGRQPMVQLERTIGGQALISQLTIRSEGRVLEELRNYNTYANLHYQATETEGAMNRRSKLEGCAPSYLPADNSFIVPNLIGQSIAVNAVNNGTTLAANCWKPVRRKLCLPLLGGLFTNPRSHPAMVMPLEVEIIAEKAARALRLCCRGDGTGGAAAAGVYPGTLPDDCINIPATATAPGNIARRHVFIQNRAAWGAPGGGTNAAIEPSPAAAQPGEGQQALNAVFNCPYRVGQRVAIGMDNNLGGDNYGAEVAGAVMANIVSMKVMDSTHGTAPGMVSLTFDQDIVDGLGATSGQNVFVLRINPITEELFNNQGTIGYTIFQPRLVVQKVIPPPQVVQQISAAIAKGDYNTDIISYVNIDNAIPATQTTSTNILAVDLTRVKSIISIPTSQTDTDKLTTSNSLQGQYLSATEYEYQIDGKLAPDRRVDLRREQFPPVRDTAADEQLRPYRLGAYAGGFHRFEVEKAIRSSNIALKNLQFITKQPTNYATLGANQFSARIGGDWCIGRSLGAGVGTSQNLVSKSVLLYLNYNANSNMVKLLKNFLIHIRTISVSMAGVSVFY